MTPHKIAPASRRLLPALVTLFLLVFGLTPTSASASSSHGGAVSLSVAPNACHIPEAAGPGSLYAGSYHYCGPCVDDAAYKFSSTKIWHCTYNPSNGYADLHYGDTSQHCHLPTSAGPGSTYHGSYSSCVDCAAKVHANEFGSNPVSGYWYCTYNPGNGLTDLHRG